MSEAKKRIIFPLDVPTAREAREFVAVLADEVGLFKVGLELFVQCGPDIIRHIRNYSQAGIFLDLKLHDIPATVKRAMRRINEFDVTFTTVHCGESPAMLDAAVAGADRRVGVLGVTVLTSVSARDIASAGFRETFSEDVARLVLQRAAMAQKAGCRGVVCSPLEVPVLRTELKRRFVLVTPGVRPQWETSVQADDQKRVTTPAQAIRNGSDYLVIGRPIRDAVDPVAATRLIVEEIDAALNQH